MKRLVYFGLCACLASGCLQILGTESLEPCTGDQCDDDDGAGGDDCVDVTMTLPDVVEVIAVSDDGSRDFKKGTRTECLDSGDITFTAVCSEGEDKDAEVAVVWGNARCSNGSTCTIDVEAKEDFTVSLAPGASCP